MSKRKACLISKFIYENDTRLQQQASILNQNDFDVSVICYLEDKKFTSPQNGINVYSASQLGDKDSLLKYIWNTIKFIFPAFVQLQKLNYKHKFDVIIIHTLPEALIFIAFLQKLFGSKLVLDVRDTSVELFDTKWNMGSKKIIRSLVVFLANISCHFATNIIVASPGFRDKLLERKIPEEKITVIFNSADTSIFKFDKSRKFEKISSNLKIVYHGSIADRFGLDIAIRAFQKVLERIPNSEFNLYGFYDTEYKMKLNNMLKELDIEDRVKLNDKQSLDKIYELIKEADLGVVPYKNEFFMQLAFSTKLFEYVTSGIPVVASKLKPAESVFSNNSLFYFDANNSDQLAEKIIYACENPEIRSEYVQTAYSDYLKISSEVMNRRYLGIISDLTN